MNDDRQYAEIDSTATTAVSNDRQSECSQDFESWLNDQLIQLVDRHAEFVTPKSLRHSLKR